MYFLALFPFWFSTITATPQEPEKKCPEITCQEFAQNIKSDPTIKIIDVRMKAEFRTGHIENAINLPLSRSVPKRARFLDKNASYYLYCTGGTRSCKAATQYLASGFKIVYSLKGGINGWKKAGLPVK
jgi:rhodanese-related sulfurtransferase